jgi:hypothetical protein
MAERHRITPQGLQLLKGKFQRQFLAEQCQDLANCLSDAIAATMKAAPIRVGKRYIHDRSESRATQAEEARWEDALFRSRWADPPAGSGAPWKRLLTYQVPLQNATSDENWGEIDLLGVSDSDLPVVIELKAPGSEESPAEMLVQATAYAVAVRKAWPSCLRAEWAETLHVSPDSLPEELDRCEIVCAAPSEYWDNWVGDPARSASDPWAAISELRRSLAKSGYPAQFVRLDHEGPGPSNISVAEQTLPEG